MEIITNGSTRIGFIGYTDVHIDSPFYADKCNRGIAKFDINDARENIKQNRNQVDILIVNLHWGIEYFHLPTPNQILYARELIDAGADIIIGHHPHMLQGIEKYRHGIIAYSLGNFVFSDIIWDWETDAGEQRSTYYRFSKRNRESIILLVDIDQKNGPMDYSLYGVFNSFSGQVEYPYQRAEIRINELSKSLYHQDYARFFLRELKKFKRRTMIKQTLRRFARIYKIRPKHLFELTSLIRKWNQSGSPIL